MTDPDEIKKHSLFQDGKAGFSLRLNVLPLMMGKVSVWISAAPGNMAMIKKEAEDRGLKESSAKI